MFVDVTWSTPRTIEYPAGCASTGEGDAKHAPTTSDVHPRDRDTAETKEEGFR